VNLIRTIRLDPSDTFVFERAAEPGEWAVCGTFMFSDIDPGALQGKSRSAFRAGFLGVTSLGWSTLVQIVEASDEDCDALRGELAKQFVDKFGAPDMIAACAAADEEIRFTASLCHHPKDTLIALHRTFEDGQIRETFRTLQPRSGPRPLRAFSFLEAEDEEPPQEQVDLVRIAQDQRS
jgi:hypothetical protein